MERARQRCGHLAVGLTTDRLAEKQKRRAIIPYEHRRTVLLAMRVVDEVVPHDGESKRDAIERHTADVVFIGDDYRNSSEYRGLDVPVVSWSARRAYRARRYSVSRRSLPCCQSGLRLDAHVFGRLCAR